MCPYDPAKAKALLAEAGYGPQKPLTFELMTEHREDRVQRHRHRHQGADGAHRRDGEHPPGGQGDLDEHGAPGRPVGHVRRGPAVADTLDSNAYLSTTTVAVEQLAPHRHQGRRVLRALRARRWTRPSARPSPRSSRSTCADKMYWNIISGSPFYMVAQPLDEGLRLQRRVRSALRSGLARQVETPVMPPTPDGWWAEERSTGCGSTCSGGCSRSCRRS